jgi:hypothetical protein
MSDRAGMYTGSQARARWLDADAEAIGWGSVAAREAVERLCKEVALRCQRTVAAYASANVLDEDSASGRVPSV